MSVSFGLRPGVSLGAAVDRIRQARRASVLPPTVTIDFEGSAKVFQEATQNLGLLLFIAIGVVYIVLGALYESYIHPITILSGLPSAGLGALVTLWLFGNELNIYSFVGLIMLIGIVKKNAIMQIDFALDAERQLGMSPTEAIYEGCLDPLPADHDDDDGGAARRVADRGRASARAAKRGVRSGSRWSAA